MEDGIISQQEFDVKKRQLLGISRKLPYPCGKEGIAGPGDSKKQKEKNGLLLPF